MVNSVKPGGKILIMIYNEFSIYRLIHNPIQFLTRLALLNFKNNQYNWSEKNKSIRAVNDQNEHGEAAPYTAYSSKREFTSRIDSKWNVKSENISGYSLFRILIINRRRFLSLVRIAGGLDLYAFGVKCADPQ